MNKINIILLTPHSRSGSILIQSLFDSHPQVVSFPILYDWYNFFPDLSKTKEFLINEFISNSVSMLSPIKNNLLGIAYYSDIKEAYKKLKEIDEQNFRNIFLELYDEFKPQTHKEMFEIFHFALAKVLGKDLNDLKYIFIHMHLNFSNKDRELNFLINSYPNFYYLPSIRDMRENYLGLRRTYRCIYNVDNDIRILVEILDGFKYHKINYEANVKICKIAKHILFVDLNKLHLLGAGSIANFLDIDEKFLNKSTFLYHPYLGNSSDKNNIVGLQKNRAKLKWQKDLPKIYKIFIHKCMYNIVKSYNYEVPKLTLHHKIYFYTYFIYMLLTVQIIKLNDRDKQILASIKQKNDIRSSFFKLFPLKIAKFLIHITIFKNRNVKYICKKYNFKNYMLIFKTNSAFKKIHFCSENFL